jgi:hypothetical protein
VEPVAIVLAFAAVTGFIVLVALAVKRAEERRLAELQQVAAAMGFTFEGPADAASLAASVGALPLFERGHSRRALCVLRGAIAELPVVLTDYQYVTGSGKNRSVHTQTVAVFTDAGRGLPDFELRPEHLFHKIGQVFGYQDIDFEGQEEFSKRYLLRGSDEAAVRAAFGPQALAFLTGQPGWSVQTREGRLAVFRERKRAKPPTMPAFLAEALRVAGALSPRGAS